MAKEKATNGPIRSMEDFKKRFGARRVDVSRSFGVLPTGSLKLDRALGGGIPKGKMTEIYGPPGGGKTTLALKIAGLELGKGNAVAYYDLEKGLDLRDDDFDKDGFIAEAKLAEAEADDTRVARRTSWLRTNGIDPNDPNFHIYEPASGEELFTMLGAGLPFFGLQIVDSVPAIMPAKVLEGEPGDATYGARAKLLAEELPRLLALWGSSDTAVIFINQVRENIGAQIKSQKATGGWALDHYVRCKLKTQRINRKDQGDDVITDTRIKIEKNIYGANREEQIRISAKRGIDTLHELMEIGVDFGYIMMSGSWHYFFNKPISVEDFKAAQHKKKISDLPDYLGGQNGEGNALDWMAASGWTEKLYPLAQKTFGA